MHLCSAPNCYRARRRPILKCTAIVLYCTVLYRAVNAVARSKARLLGLRPRPAHLRDGSAELVDVGLVHPVAVAVRRVDADEPRVEDERVNPFVRLQHGQSLCSDTNA